ncbi:MAG TPA: dipeptidase [Chitinophagaceae bacterium]|nr:dipeptidase [Chitinophagaceae bacterium]
MRKISLIICILFTQQITAQSYQKIHDKAIVVDTHNDILMKSTENGLVFDQNLKGKTHSDLARWKQGGLDVQLFSVFCDGDKKNPYTYANRQMDSLDAVVKRNPDKIVKVSNTKELYKTVKQHKIAAMFGVEGGHMIEDNLNNIDVFYKRGARYMTLTWNNSTTWATSAFDETFKKDLQHKGLTDFGKQVVKRMNELGMIVDVSHVGETTFWDVIKTTTKPIIASHSCVYNLCAHQRNLKDDQIKAIAKNGGVIQVNFYSGFLDSDFMKRKDAFIERHKTERDSIMKSGKEYFFADEYLFAKYTDEVNALRAPLSLLIQHIEYIIKLVGVDYVGLGSDFDGIESPPQELDDVTTYPLITKALVEKGYSKKDITKILGGNFLRVMKANEKRVN